eukprot:167391-Lingulodinium_polyedra.AAC.1
MTACASRSSIGTRCTHAGAPARRLTSSHGPCSLMQSRGVGGNDARAIIKAWIMEAPEKQQFIGARPKR